MEAIAARAGAIDAHGQYRPAYDDLVVNELLSIWRVRHPESADVIEMRLQQVRERRQKMKGEPKGFTPDDWAAVLARIAILESNEFTQAQAATLEAELKNLISQVQAGEQADLANYYPKAYIDTLQKTLQAEIDGKHGALTPSEQRVVDRFVFVDGDLALDARHYSDYDGKIIIADSNGINGQSIDFAGGNIPSDFNCEVWCLGARCAFTDSSPVAIQSSIPGDALLRGDKAVVYKIQNTGPGVVRLAVDYANRGSHASSSSRVEQLAQDITTLRALVNVNTRDVETNRSGVATLVTRMDGVEVANAAQATDLRGIHQELNNLDAKVLPAGGAYHQVPRKRSSNDYDIEYFTLAGVDPLTAEHILDTIQATRTNEQRGRVLATAYDDANSIVLREDTDYYVLTGDTELEFTTDRNQDLSATQLERTYTSTVGDSILLQGENSLVEVNLGVPRGWYVNVVCDTARDNTDPSFQGNQIISFDSGVTVTGDYSVVAAGDVYEVRGTAANTVNVRKIWPVTANPVHLPTVAQLLSTMYPGGISNADRNDLVAISNRTGFRLVNPRGRVLDGSSILASLDSTPAATDYGKYIELRPGTTDLAGAASLAKVFEVQERHEVAIRSDVRGDISNVENRLYHETWGATVVLVGDDSSIGFQGNIPMGWWCHVLFRDDRNTSTPWYSTGVGVYVWGIDQVAGHVAPKRGTVFRMIAVSTNSLRLEEVYPVTRAHYSPTRPFNVIAEAGSDVNTGATANSDTAGVHARTWASLDGAVIKMISDGSATPEINLNTGAPIGTQFEVVFSGDMVGQLGSWINAARGVTLLPLPTHDTFFGAPRDDCVWNLKCIDTNQWYLSVTGPPHYWEYRTGTWTNASISILISRDRLAPYQWMKVGIFSGQTEERFSSTHYIPQMLNLSTNGSFEDAAHGVTFTREATGVRVSGRGVGSNGLVNNFNYILLHN